MWHGCARKRTPGPTLVRIVVDSRFSRNELTALAHIDPARIDVVYPGVSEEIMRVERRPDAAGFILAVGTVERRKNLEVVIRALRALDGVLLLAVGPFTPYRAECERIARECSVSDRVKFRGYVTREELLQLYAHAAVAVVPSTYEGFGYGVAQALCAGVPCVAADTSSLPEIADGSAALLQAHDVSAWSAALEKALSDRNAAEARAASVRASAIERFSWKSSAEAMIASYRAALG
jgi:glycosyltransferase involved in cell wall biosynthesis